MHRIVRPTGAILLATALIAVWTGPVAAQSSREYAEDLVRAVYYEGLPYAAAAAIDDKGAERLIEMLGEPDTAPYHANILIALGISAQPGAFEAISGYAERPFSGRVDRLVFRNQLAAPVAMGYLARHTPDAVTWLASEASRSDDPGWAVGRLSSTRVRQMLRSRAISGLALSGRPQAASALQQLDAELRAGSRPDADLQRHLRAALALHARVVAEGPNFAPGVTP